MKQIILPNKSRGLYNKFLIRIYEASEKIAGASRKEFIPFPQVFEKICRNFSIKKSEAWDYLEMYEELGFISIIKFKGIRLNYKLKVGDNIK